jgi:two-component system chemotaxis sensor kinase CheA
MEPDPKLLKLLVETFTLELEEQTQIMVDAILALEKIAPENANFMKKIDTLFRAAHNIKGASRGIGIIDVGNLSHQLESLFSSVQKKTVSLSSSHIDLVLETIDKMRMSMQAYLHNQPINFDINDLLSRLQSNINQNVASDAKTIEMTNNNDIIIKESPAGLDTKTAEYIRVSITNIDRVSTLMEEIQVAKFLMQEHENSFNSMALKLRDLKESWKNNKNINDIADLISEINDSASQLQKSFRYDVNDLFALTNLLQDEVGQLRLVPASLLLRTLPRAVRDLSQELDKNVELLIKGDDVKMDKLILEGLNDPFIHLIRNAIDHGIQTSHERIAINKSPQAHISIEIIDEGNEILIVFKDDGCGLDIDKISAVAIEKNLITASELSAMSVADISQLIFRPGFTTTKIITSVSGRGVGLDVVKSNLAQLKGSVSVESIPHEGTTFYLRVPLTLAGERGLIVTSSNQNFVIPTHSILYVSSLNTADIEQVEGHEVVRFDNHPILLRTLADLLDFQKSAPSHPSALFIVIIKKDLRTLALVVDEVIGEREIIVKPLQPPLSHIPCVAGATLSSGGDVVLVLNANDLIRRGIENNFTSILSENKQEVTDTNIKHILVVDDSITTRTLEQNVLENQGYKVTTALNGKEAWDLLQKETFSLLITDVNMPIMDGFELTEKVKQSEKLNAMPVIIVTSLNSTSEKKRGIEVGANAYIVKSEFESSVLLQTVSQLV